MPPDSQSESLSPAHADSSLAAAHAESSLAAQLYAIAAGGLGGALPPEFKAKCLAPTPEAFMEFLKLLGCTRMYRSSTYDRFYSMLTDGYPRNLFLLPRGSFKSTALEASCIRDLILDRNIRILYASETQDQAKKYVGFIKTQLQDNARLIAEAGAFRPRRNEHKWADDELWVAGRTDLSKKESTVTAKGLAQVRAGPHYDRIIIDDPCSPDNTRTQAGLELTVEQFKLVFAIAESVVDPATGKVLGRTRLDVSCTRYHDADMLGYIKRMNAEIEARRRAGDDTAIPWRTIEVPAEDRKGAFAFPHLPEGVLRQLESEMGRRAYSAQYLLNPVPEEFARFTRRQFRLIPEAQTPKAAFTRRYLLIDAATTKNDGDDTAIIAAARDCTGRDYILDMDVGQYSPNEVISHIFDMYVRWDVRHAVMEIGAFKNCYDAMIEAESIRRQVRLRIVPATGRTRESKERRIDSLDVPLSQDALFFSSRCPRELIAVNPADGLCYGKAVEEFLRFPHAEHDDIPDAISDLYNRDSAGNPLCPRPGAAEIAAAARPATVNGRIAPSAVRQPPSGTDFWGRLAGQIRGGTANAR